MTEKELKKLSRQELLEVLLAQSKKIDRLNGKLKETQDKLTEREIAISEAGSIAEASLILNNVFADAQKAADQYLENIRRMHDQAELELSETVRLISHNDTEGTEEETEVAEAAREETDRAETERVQEEAEIDRAEAEKAREEAEIDRAEAEKAREEAERDRAEAEKAREEAEKAREEAERARAEAEADRAAAAQYLEEIARMKEQTEQECAERKKRADKQIRHSLIRTKKAVQQMMGLYANEVMKRVKMLQEWDKQMEALRERENNKRSARSEE